jgi:hypothetical protein
VECDVCAITCPFSTFTANSLIYTPALLRLYICGCHICLPPRGLSSLSNDYIYAAVIFVYHHGASLLFLTSADQPTKDSTMHNNPTFTTMPQYPTTRGQKYLYPRIKITEICRVWKRVMSNLFLNIPMKEHTTALLA